MNQNQTENLTPEQELEKLRSENAQREKVSAELEKLWTMFPDADLENAPDRLWELVESGESLLGAYCIMLAESDIEARKADAKNTENARRTPPAVRSDDQNKEFFTREQVNKMSREQVRKYYDRIVESMKHWD